jgi:ribose transport system permease protein
MSMRDSSVAPAPAVVAGVAKKNAFRSRLRSGIGLVALIVLALIVSPHAPHGGLVFLQLGNLTDILRQVSEIGIISLGMTFVIITGGIDLSVGTILALASSVSALLVTTVALPFPPSVAMFVAAMAGILSAGLVGLVNGLVIARWNLQPFVVTLATMIGIRGLARWLTGNTNIDLGFGSDLGSAFASAFSGKLVVVGSYVLLTIAAATLLSKTLFGRYARAVGDNEKAARYAGLPIARVRILVYTLTAALAGFAGVLHAAQNHQGNPNSGVAYELDAIAAVVIGGTSLLGGSGSIFGTVIGTLIMGVLTNMLRLKNVDANLEMMLKAVIIVVAVWLQQSTRREA